MNEHSKCAEKISSFLHEFPLTEFLQIFFKTSLKMHRNENLNFSKLSYEVSTLNEIKSIVNGKNLQNTPPQSVLIIWRYNMMGGSTDPTNLKWKHWIGKMIYDVDRLRKIAFHRRWIFSWVSWNGIFFNIPSFIRIRWNFAGGRI